MASIELEYAKVYARKPIMNIFDIDSGYSLMRCIAKTMEADNGYGGEKITQVDNQGYEYNVGTNINERKSTITLTFGGNNFDISALQQGKKIQSETAKIKMPWKQQVLKTSYPGVTSGKQAYGMAADSPTNGTALDANGNYIILTQQNFASFTPGTPNSFAIGENFARKFSDDLLANRNFVALRPDLELIGKTFSEIDLGYLAIEAIYYNSTGSIDYFSAPYAIVDVLGSGYKPGDQVPTVKFDLANLGSCQPYKVLSSNQVSFCDS